MYASFETNSNEILNKGQDSIIKIDSNINSLSWMSKSTYSNQSLKNNDNSNQLDKFLYYQEGWLATGNSNCIVGCTFTTCFTEQQYAILKSKAEKQNKLKEISNNNTSNNQNTDAITQSNTANNNSVNTAEQTTINYNLTRTNFNLRGHKSEIKFVKWNEPYQKLATCDTKGLIYVWIKYEGRWSIELINDRGNSVSDFAWSHDGRAAVICYQDGFVLVGSVNGQRYWSHLYDLPNSNITSVTWTPNDNFIIMGLSNGTIMVVDSNGTIQSRHNIKNNESITNVSYNCPKFFINDLNISSEGNVNNTSFSSSNLNTNRNNSNNNLSRINRLSTNFFNLFNNNENVNVNINNNNFLNSANESPKINSKINNQNYLLTLSFSSNGMIYLLKSYDDLDPIIIDTKLENAKFEWSNCGKILAVGGYELIKKEIFKTNNNNNNDNNNQQPKNKKKKSFKTTASNYNTFTINKEYINYVHFYNIQGILLYKLEIPSIKKEKNILGNKLNLTSNHLVEKVKKLGDCENFSTTPGIHLESQPNDLSTTSNQESSIFSNNNNNNNYFSALVWGHNDQRLFVACTNTLHILRVYKEIPSFSLLSQIAIKTALKESSLIDKFCLPERLKQQLKYCFTSTIKSIYPRLHNLRKFVCTCLPSSERLHCTLKCIKTKNNYEYYTLYLEYLGGLIPLLSARKSSKLKPNFVIFDPILSIENKTTNNEKSKLKYRNNIKKHKLLGNNTGFSNIKKREESLATDNVKQDISADSQVNSRDTTPNKMISSNENLKNSETKLFNIKNISSGYNSSSTTDSSTSSNKNKINTVKTTTNLNEIISVMDNNNSQLLHINEQNNEKKTNISISSSCLSFNSSFESTQNNSFLNNSKLANSQTNLSSSLSSLNSFSNIKTFKNSLSSDIKFNKVLAGKKLAKKPKNCDNQSNVIRFRRNILVKVKANIWGTKFKFHGVKYLPKQIGNITYKTSLFHLQPRQMTICLEDLTYLSSVDFDKLNHRINNDGSNHTNNLNRRKSKYLKADEKQQSINSTINNNMIKENQPIKQEKVKYSNIESIKSINSSIIGAFPANLSLVSQPDSKIIRKSNSCLSISSTSSILQNNRFNNHQLNINDKMSTAQQLIERTFIKNNDIINIVNLPQLKLVSEDSISDYNQEEFDTHSCCLITSNVPIDDSINENEAISICDSSNSLEKNSLARRANSILNKFTSDLLRYLTNKRLFLTKSNSIDNSLLEETFDEDELNENDGTYEEDDDENYYDLEHKTSSSNINNINTTNNKNTNANYNNEEDENENLISNIISKKTIKSKFNFTKNKYLIGMRKNNKIVTKKKKKTPKNSNLKRKNKFVLHNKPPIWNETNQVYQLDFGGRVTQESAKNFQIEFNGKQVMQFGRIDSNAYTLDFEWPFTTIHAFSIALANITQRLK